MNLAEGGETIWRQKADGTYEEVPNVHLVLENAEDEELNTVINYCKAVGLPTCLADLGVKEVTPEKVMKVAIGATAEGETIHNMPFPVTADMVCGAIFAADKLGAH